MRSSVPPLLLLMLGVAAVGVARADDETPELAGIVRSAVPGAGSFDAPRFVRIDSPAEPLRSLPGYRGATTELGYRWWLSSGRADLGLGLGTIAYVSRPTGSVPGLVADGSSNVIASATVLTLGLRYRTSERSAVFADAAGLRGSGLGGGEAVVGKVGVEFKLARSSWHIAYGGLGLRLAGDTRMTLRVRRGGLGLYMHSSF